ncbi:DNA-processing protein DprA [Tsukamurella sp. 8F]|uniref:DNA-processing protein DprA n=1 Tax=unclassified Tsukamurella TaxID=2633480 RepID=UPI0023B8AC41|nr:MULTISPECIES: DNA-processing protein DprA [unclassified Tsukamurella]MDF0528933.1 DNA-processing protein DprA [Tsukamurella sp. 8J]MDF0589472.1 DNA-processing protein DprA [Tsukamurella sp. 8F]
MGEQKAGSGNDAGGGGIDDARRAYALLTRLVEAPSAAMRGLIDEFGAVETADMLCRGLPPPGFEALVSATAARVEDLCSGGDPLDRADADLRHVARLGGRLVVPEDPEWPAWALHPLAERVRPPDGGHDDEWRELRPFALWVVGAGRLDELLDRAVALVGTRAPSSYGEHVARWFAGDLAAQGFTVVSGGAYGIDAAAHRGALASGGATVAILGAGVDRPYPAGHAQLFRAMGERGALVSEYPPGTPPGRHRFLNRNRLVACATRGVVVVEAGLRSGTRNTASWAARRSLPVCAVPGPVTTATSVTCHTLIRDGAELVTSAADVVFRCGAAGEMAPQPEAPARPTDGLTPAQLQVHDAFPARSELGVSELARRSGQPPASVRAALTVLELRELVEPAGARWRLVRRGDREREV